MRSRQFVAAVVVLVLALPATALAAEPAAQAETRGFVGRLVDLVLAAIGYTGPPPSPPEPTTSSTGGGETDGGPENDPNG